MLDLLTMEVQIAGTQQLRHTVQRLLTLEKTIHVRGRDPGHGAARLEGRRSDVRSKHNIRHGAEARADGRLELVNVESGAAEVAALEGVAEGALIDDRASRGVDDERAPLHPGERGRVDQMLRLAAERRVDRNDVTGCQQTI